MRRLLGPVFIAILLGLVLPSTPVAKSLGLIALADDKPTEAKEEESADKGDEDADEKDADDDGAEDKEQAEEKADADKPQDKPAEEKADKADTKSDEKKPDEKKAAAKPAKKKRTTHKVAPKKLTVDFTVDGSFVADNMTEVILRPDSWMDYEIVEVVPHGAEVHAGDVLVKFDSKRIDEAIAEMELEQRLGELSLLRAEAELPRIEKMLAMTMTDAEQANERTLEDYDLYQKEERDLIVKLAKANLDQSTQMLQYEKDELEQLEKMYKADDLTEETEEIVLKRQRAAVKMAETYLKVAEFSYDYQVRLSMPRQDADIKESVDRQKLSYERTKSSLQLDLNKARYELEQERAARTKALEKHAKLLADRALMTIKAPVDGTVYYGRCTQGQWTDLGSMIEKLKPHGRVNGETVMMTIVDRRPLHLEAQIGEGVRPHVAVGQSAEVTPVGDEQSKKISAKVESVTSIPVAQGKFGIKLSIKESDLPEWLVPGLTGKVKVTTYEKKNALVAPKKAVHAEEDDADEKYVWLVDGEDVEKREVTTGKTKGEEIEITDGLEKGDVISLDDEKKREDDEKDKD